MKKEELIIFEKDIADLYKQGLIRGPIHLRDGNEDILIEIFKNKNALRGIYIVDSVNDNNITVASAEISTNGPIAEDSSINGDEELCLLSPTNVNVNESSGINVNVICSICTYIFTSVNVYICIILLLLVYIYMYY